MTFSGKELTFFITRNSAGTAAAATTCDAGKLPLVTPGATDRLMVARCPVPNEVLPSEFRRSNALTFLEHPAEVLHVFQPDFF